MRIKHAIVVLLLQLKVFTASEHNPLSLTNGVIYCNMARQENKILVILMRMLKDELTKFTGECEYVSEQMIMIGDNVWIQIKPNEKTDRISGSNENEKFDDTEKIAFQNMNQLDIIYKACMLIKNGIVDTEERMEEMALQLTKFEAKYAQNKAKIKNFISMLHDVQKL